MGTETAEQPVKKYPFGRVPKEEQPVKPGDTNEELFDIDPNKRYWFQLIKTYEKLKPIDSKSGLRDENLYPPYYIAYREGVAKHNGKYRRWRYLYGYPSIWVDEQQDPEPTDIELSDARNSIVFLNGNCFVDGSNKAKITAMMLQDSYEGQLHPVNNSPKAFRLVNEDEVIHKASESGDKAFEAEQAARNATFEEMIPVAMLFGINVDDAQNREEIIRKQFILKSRQLPDAFLKQFVNPRNKIKYLVTKALRENIIMVDLGHVIMAETKKVLFDVDTTGDVSEQITAKIMGNDNEAGILYAHIQKIIA